jgi:hypothetical protein
MTIPFSPTNNSGPLRLGAIIRRMADKIRHPKKETREDCAARVLDEHFLGPWSWLLDGDAWSSPGERAKLKRDIRGAIVAAYKEGYQRGRKRR